MIGGQHLLHNVNQVFKDLHIMPYFFVIDDVLRRS